jgi:hypothetical protein
MDWLRLTLALLLPWGAGAVWLRWRWHDPPPGAWALVLGYGYLLGMLTTTLIMRVMDLAGLPQNFLVTSALLTAVAIIGLWLSRDVAWFDRGLHRGNPARQTSAVWERVAIGVLLAIIVVRYAGLALEVYWRPLFPWDAWTVWAVKSKVWFELKHLMPFVDGLTWKNHPGQVYTVEAWHYPRTVSLVSTWMALALGRWDDALVNLPWLLCAIALGLGFYGQSRAWGVAPLPSLVFTYLLLSLPLLNTHVALAGYADLWLAASYGFAGMAFLQWLRTGAVRYGLLALGFGVACVTIKVEGLLWLLTFAPALFVSRAPLKVAVMGMLVILVGIAVWLLSGGLEIHMPGVGEVIITPETIAIPHIGRFNLLFNVDWQPFVINLFVFDNWHLLWFLFVVVALLALPARVKRKSLIAPSVFVLTGFIALGFVFFFTSAATWASDSTAINRLLMHMVPVVVFYILVIVHDGLLELGSPEATRV